MKITVVGCGRLGAPYAAGLAALGHEVLGLDTNTETAALLHAGKAPFAEPGLAEAITDGAATGRLTFTSSYAHAAAHADIHFIAVPTPQAAGSAHHDLRDVFAAAESLAREITRGTLVVVKSSVPAGTSARVKARMMQLVPAGVTVEVPASPDFMREAHSIADVRRPTRIVLGVEPGGKAETTLRRVWAQCLAGGVPLVVTDLITTGPGRRSRSSTRRRWTARAEFPELTYATEPAAVAEGASVLPHLTNWPEFGRVVPAQLAPGERPTLIDARRGLLHHADWRAAGWSVHVL